nr:tRNA (adenosine(37)-N6)-dimethylallyltransferase MiaA [Oculatella sp. LEGE 06141]
MKSAVPILIVICGPTATGKSGLAIALSHHLPAVILSADSRQVYREFNIGTAKPSISDRLRVPHYLIDSCNPTETLTLAEYQAQAQALIRQCHEKCGRVGDRPTVNYGGAEPWSGSAPIPLLVGGTGLYIRSIVRGMQIPRVAPQPELRSQLQNLGQPQCYSLLRQVDAASAQKIHPNDQVRTLRALEVFYTTGRSITVQQGERPPLYPILQIGLDCLAATDGSSRSMVDDPLTARIKQRTHQMIADGFVEEVETLCQTYGADLPLLNTLGYQEVKQYLAGDLSLPEAIDLTVLHTRQFAKRQRTWFRADRQIEWFDADHPDLVAQVWQRVQQFLTMHSARL